MCLNLYQSILHPYYDNEVECVFNAHRSRTYSIQLFKLDLKIQIYLGNRDL